jgi:hypothetical protein
MNATPLDPSMWHWTAAPRWDTADPPGLAITAWFPAQELGALTAAISQLIPRPSHHRR